MSFEDTIKNMSPQEIATDIRGLVAELNMEIASKKKKEYNEVRVDGHYTLDEIDRMDLKFILEHKLDVLKSIASPRVDDSANSTKNSTETTW